MSRLMKAEAEWLNLAQQHSYASLSDESKKYYDFLMQKVRIPEAVEKKSTTATKQVKAPTKQPQEKAPKGEAKMLVFMIGFVIIGFAARMLWLDWKSSEPPKKAEKHENTIRRRNGD